LPWLLGAVVIFGIVCRVSQYAANTSVWHDEAYVALNVLHKAFAGLLGPLDWHEPAPPGFLMLEKFVTQYLGRSEYAFRLIPLVAGVTGLIGFARLAHRISVSRLASVWAVLLMAASAKLIVQANEIKHFTLDLLLAVLLTWMAIRIWSLQTPAAALCLWGAVGAVGLWLSYASVFVFGGTSLVLAWRAVQGWSWPARTAYLTANLGALVSFWFLLGPIAAQRTGTVVAFWHKAFPDLMSPVASIFWLGRSTLGFFNYLWQPLGLPALVLAVLGGMTLWRTRRGVELACLALPGLLAVGAAVVRHWPFGGNHHMVFAAPAALILTAEGLEALRGRLSLRHPVVGWTLIASLLLPGLADAVYRIWSSRLRHEVRPAIEYVRRHLVPGDRIVAQDPATVEFYAPDLLVPSPGSDASARVWFIYSGSVREGSPVHDLANRVGARRQRLRTVETHGAGTILFGPETHDGRKGRQE
jgi:hypothetical protein